MIQTTLLTAARAALLAAALVAFWPAQASAEQIRYSGTHPIPEAVDGEFCYIEFPHVHVYKPKHAATLYRVENDHYHFVGDPVAHGYDGPKYSYYGHHPVVIDPDVHIHVGEPVTEYCYLDGPHFHGYEPPPGLTFELKGGAHWYIGKYPKPYYNNRKRYARVNAVYTPVVYERPVVEVDAPPVGYVGPVVEVVTPAVEVHAPSVEVHVPVPTIDIHVGGPGVIVGGHRHHKHKKFKKYRKRGKHKGWRRHRH
jgi:hypothetical protein